MRVITGKAKGRKLMMVPGEGTRPITDRAKSALFSILSDWIVGARVLDLFGGTGAVGIECLSRGAEFVQFIDLDRRAVETIQANLRHCGLASQAAVERADSLRLLAALSRTALRLHLRGAAPVPGSLAPSPACHRRPPRADRRKCHHRRPNPSPRSRACGVDALQEYDRRKYGSVMLVFYGDAADLAEGDRERGRG